MRTALDIDEALLDDAERRFTDNIRKHGWFNNRILADEEGPAYNFTTGFQVGLDVPEIITFALPQQVAHNLLWHVYRQLSSGKRYETGKPYPNFLEGFDVCFQVVDRTQYHEYLGWSRWFYAGDTFDCWQLIWPDKQGFFPWQSEFSAGLVNLQPDLSAARWDDMSFVS